MVNQNFIYVMIYENVHLFQKKKKRDFKEVATFAHWNINSHIDIIRISHDILQRNIFFQILP